MMNEQRETSLTPISFLLSEGDSFSNTFSLNQLKIGLDPKFEKDAFITSSRFEKTAIFPNQNFITNSIVPSSLFANYGLENVNPDFNISPI
jgi:hypothetical protein